MLFQLVTSAVMVRDLNQTLVVRRSRNRHEVVLRQSLDNLSNAYFLRPTMWTFAPLVVRPSVMAS